jgi:hypothetical protein
VAKQHCHWGSEMTPWYWQNNNAIGFLLIWIISSFIHNPLFVHLMLVTCAEARSHGEDNNNPFGDEAGEMRDDTSGLKIIIKEILINAKQVYEPTKLQDIVKVISETHGFESLGMELAGTN